MKYTLNYGQDVLVLPARPLLERAKKATKTDLYLLFVLASDHRLRAHYEAEADRAAAEVGVARSDLDRALSFWQGAGVIDVEEAEESAPQAPAKPPRKADPPATEHKLMREDVLPHYTTEQVTDLLNSRAEAKALNDAAQQTFGKMFTTMETTILLGMMDYLALENEYILTLLAWCAGKGKKSLRYVEKMAIGLYDAGIRDTEALNHHLRHRDETDVLVAELRKLFGVGGRTLTTKEKAAFGRWIDEYHYGINIITSANEMTVDDITTPSIPYTDSILSRWHSEGLDTLEKIEADAAARSKGKNENSRASSFDADEFFEDALRRSYS